MSCCRGTIAKLFIFKSHMIDYIVQIFHVELASYKFVRQEEGFLARTKSVLVRFVRSRACPDFVERGRQSDIVKVPVDGIKHECPPVKERNPPEVKYITCS